MRTVVTFHSAAFNTVVQKPYFINPGCFGDDLLHWVIGELRRKGLETDDKPGQEDFGWFLNFQIAGIRSTLVVGYRPGDEGEDGTWIGWLERSRGFVGSMLGARNRDIDPAAAEMIHAILTSSSEVRDVRWHSRPNFDQGKEDVGGPAP
jgi:hypothetical protein